MFAEHQARPDRRALLLGAAASPFLVRRASAADPIRTYSIWPESYARPVLEAFEKASGVPVKFVRFSSGEALARVLAERNNPQIDVLFGGPVETFAAGEVQGVFDAYTSSARLTRRCCRWRTREPPVQP